MTEKVTFILNNELIVIDINPAIPLLDFIRKEMRLVGTKEVCKEGDCGACTVMIGELINDQVIYKTVTSCIYPIGNVSGKHVVTIEGLNIDGLTPQQEAFVEEGASQCGFCTPGFVVSATNYLVTNEQYNYKDAINSIGGNVCRCTGYSSITRAMKKIIDQLNAPSTKGNFDFFINRNVIPGYFENVSTRLLEIKTNSKGNGFNNDLFIGGGSDLFVQMPELLLQKKVSFINRKKMNFIREDEKQIYIGAGTTFEEFKNSTLINSYFPKLYEQLFLVASLPIRNTATVGGNIANASPIGDLTIILLALNSTLVITDIQNESKREAKLKDFYLGYKKLNKQPYEIIEMIRFPKPDINQKFNFEKVSKRTYLDIASVNTAISIGIDNNLINACNISAGGIAPIPKYLKQTSNFLIGKKLNVVTVLTALDVVQNEISPISDVRGSAEYKRLLINQLIKAHFVELFPGKFRLEELI